MHLAHEAGADDGGSHFTHANGFSSRADSEVLEQQNAKTHSTAIVVRLKAKLRIRIRLTEGPKVKRTGGKNRHLAEAVSALLTPAAVMAAILATWRICAGINLTGEFAIREGLFSHWATWLGLAGVLEFTAVMLGRYGARR